jgi:hypothetical protein
MSITLRDSNRCVGAGHMHMHSNACSRWLTPDTAATILQQHRTDSSLHLGVALAAHAAAGKPVRPLPDCFSTAASESM